MDARKLKPREFDKQKKSFGKMSSLYNKLRPKYPKKVAKDIFRITKVKKGNILDIGCGSGQATTEFCKKNLKITALDIDKNQLHQARKNLPKDNVHFIHASFEKARLPNEQFDLIVSAQAFHWVNLKIGFKKAHKVLKKGGHMALFWNVAYFESNKFLRSVENLHKKYFSMFAPGSNIKRTTANFKNSGFFEKFITKQYNWNKKYSKEEYLNLTKTFSWIATVDEKTKKRFLKELADLIDSYKKPLYIRYKVFLVIGRKSNI